MKNFSTFLVPFIILVFSTSYVNGQIETNTAMASTSIVSGVETINPKSISLISNATKKTTIKKPVSYEMISIDESKFSFKVSADFGSYVIPNTNYLKVVASDGIVYSNAQLTEKSSGKSIFNLKLNVDKDVIDMTETKPGVYTLILTNARGNIYTEDIMIM